VPVISNAVEVRDSQANLGDGKKELKKRVKAYVANTDYKDGRFHHKEEYDLESGPQQQAENAQWGHLTSTDTPFFHIDIPDLSNLPFDDKLNSDEYTSSSS
jgi:sodium-independent sulfate anion transporter 11